MNKGILLANDADKIIKDFINQKSSNWQFANTLLYELCKKYHKHNNADQIVAKLWIIGRCYSVDFARYKKSEKNKNMSSEDYYYFAVNKLLNEYDFQKEIDERIQELSKYKEINEENISKVLECHKRFIDLFHKVDENANSVRSLASKYLHFHLPNLFFIYDERAKISISKLIKKNTNLKYEDSDLDYKNFCIKALKLKEYINNNYDKTFTIRDLDNLLLFVFKRSVR